jgi:predicted transposase YbfD/YdcC
VRVVKATIDNPHRMAVLVASAKSLTRTALMSRTFRGIKVLHSKWYTFYLYLLHFLIYINIFSVKKNQKELYRDVSEMIDFKLTDKHEQFNAPLEKASKTEKGHGRIDKRTAFVTHEAEWLAQFGKWHGVQMIGAVVTDKETRYYISSRKLSPMELLLITRNEWAVESMHWQLDVIFNEDRTTLHEANSQKTLNILRKTVLNVVRTYRDTFEPKRNMVDIMRNCLFDTDILLDVLLKFHICFHSVTN